MRKLLLAVAAVILAACVSKVGSPAVDQSVATPAAARAAPAAPAEPSNPAPKADESMKAAAKTKKAKRMVNVAKTTQQKTPQESLQQKLPVSERARRDGPG